MDLEPPDAEGGQAVLLLCWHMAAAIRRFLLRNAPSNRVIAWAQGRATRNRGFAVASASSAAYLLAAVFCAAVGSAGGMGALNALVLLFVWNATKFAWAAVWRLYPSSP